MIPLDPLPNLIDQVYARILEAITDRSLPPGHRIRQNELAEKLGVSRQPVSHALHLLHRQGLVAESGRRGFEVTRLDPERIRQLYEVRGAIDALAARLAAGRAKSDTAGRAQLETALQAGRSIDKNTPLARLIALDVDFHRAIYRLAGNPAIEEMIAPQWPHMRRSMATVLAELDYRESAWTEHEAIAAQIFAGNAKAAEAAALAHAQTAGRMTEERLRATRPTRRPSEPVGRTPRNDNKTKGGNTMKLTPQQIEFFNREGWLFLPELFSPEEVDYLAREAVSIYDANRPEVWREKSGAPRTAFAAHLYNEAFGALGAHPRMIEPIEQIFGEKLYMHQFKINAKAAFTGDVWQWHQDYGTWKRDDGMPEPRAMNIAIFLDEVMPINGPLMLVPKSQHAGDLKASHDLETTSYPLWTLDEATVTRLVKEGGIVAPTGKAGGMLMFHGNLVHGSSGNITPYPRKIVYLTLNAVSNYIRTPTRPEYIAHRDFTPIQTVDDDALLRLARAHRQAAE